jgi:orotate phosphoribosyltransferase
MVMDTAADFPQEPSQPVAVRLLDFMLHRGILKFGEFQLKSGRISPYFANFGNFCTGSDSDALGLLYAEKIGSLYPDERSVVANSTFGFGGYFEAYGDFDVVFGPAYKGVPLATHAAAGMFRKFGRDKPWAFNRKEAKDHGEGGSIVGAGLSGKRVLIVDDVITAGTAVGEAIEIIRASGGIPHGVVVAFDRMEKGKEGDLSAVQEARAKYGIPVHAIATFDDLLSRLEAVPEGPSPEDPVGEIIEAMKDYRSLYGADYSLA